MGHIYRVVLKVNYYEVYFDFEASEDAVRFCAEALEHMTDREDGRECTMAIKKINIEQEKAEEEDN